MHSLAWGWLLLPAGGMLVSFLMELEFVMRTPNVHLAEFQSAMHHREILLMIDALVRNRHIHAPLFPLSRK
jgi:hypothetical protein